MAQDKTVDYYLKIAWQSLANRYNQLATPHGITQATGYLLINIHKNGTPVTQIASLLGVKSTSLSRILSGLEQQGLIYRSTDDQDKRSVRIFLTEAGQEKRQVAKNLVKDFNGHLERQLRDQDREKLIALLKRLINVANEY